MTTSLHPLSFTDAELTTITGLSTPVPPGTSDGFNASVPVAGITLHLQLAAYAGQLCWECNFFRTFIESPATATAYEGSKILGNTEPGDGVLFRGRGAIQLTGRYNYEEFQQWLMQAGIDGWATPEDVGTPRLRYLAAAFYWATHGCNAVADDCQALTKRINGGHAGLVQRCDLTDVALAVVS